MRRLFWGLVAMLILCGCHHAQTGASPPALRPTPWGTQYPQPVPSAVMSPPPPTPHASDIATTPMSGAIGGKPYEVRFVSCWQDASSEFMAFYPLVPTDTNKQFDPRARLNPPPAALFMLTLNPTAPMKPGRWELTADAPVPKDCPVGTPQLQLTDGVQTRVVTTGWSLAIAFDEILTRQARDSNDAGLNVKGRMALRFQQPAAWLNGTFMAHDIYRDSELQADQPVLPAP